MGRDRHDSHLLANNKCATAEGDKYLTHDNVANVYSGLSKMDHESNIENGQGNSQK
jgi:hypothetical protein